MRKRTNAVLQLRASAGRSLKTEQKKPKVRAGDRVSRKGAEVVHQVNAQTDNSKCQLF